MKTQVQRREDDLRMLEAQCAELKADNASLVRANRELELSIALLLEVMVPLNRLYDRG